MTNKTDIQLSQEAMTIFRDILAGEYDTQEAAKNAENPYFVSLLAVESLVKSIEEIGEVAESAHATLMHALALNSFITDAQKMLDELFMSVLAGDVKINVKGKVGRVGITPWTNTAPVANGESDESDESDENGEHVVGSPAEAMEALLAELNVRLGSAADFFNSLKKDMD